MTEGKTDTKKGLHPLAWAGIGCGVLALVAVIGFFAMGSWLVGWTGKKLNDPVELAKLVTRFDPNIEIIGDDKNSEEIVIRNKQSGEELRISYDDIRQGKFTVKTADGTYEVDGSRPEGGTLHVTTPEGESVLTTGTGATKDLPSWLPVYPNATEAPGGFARQEGGRRDGTLTAKSTDSAGAITAFFSRELEAAGFEIENQTVNLGDAHAQTIIKGTSESPPRSVHVIVSAAGDEHSSILLQYSGPDE